MNKKGHGPIDALSRVALIGVGFYLIFAVFTGNSPGPILLFLLGAGLIVTQIIGWFG